MKLPKEVYFGISKYIVNIVDYLISPNQEESVAYGNCFYHDSIINIADNKILNWSSIHKSLVPVSEERKLEFFFHEIFHIINNEIDLDADSEPNCTYFGHIMANILFDADKHAGGDCLSGVCKTEAGRAIDKMYNKTFINESQKKYLLAIIETLRFGFE